MPAVMPMLTEVMEAVELAHFLDAALHHVYLSCSFGSRTFPSV